MRKKRRSYRILETKQGIDLAAMVDIIFLLLAYFLINSTLAKTPAIQIDLPQSETSAYVGEEAIDIHVKQSGAIFINGQETDDAAITAALQEALQKRGGKTPEVNIKGDRNTQYQRIITAIDLVRKAGLQNFNLTTVR